MGFGGPFASDSVVMPGFGWDFLTNRMTGFMSFSYLGGQKISSKHEVNSPFMFSVMATNGIIGIWLSISNLKWSVSGQTFVCYL